MVGVAARAVAVGEFSCFGAFRTRGRLKPGLQTRGMHRNAMYAGLGFEFLMGLFAGGEDLFLEGG
jgi:hypothetical protein